MTDEDVMREREAMRTVFEAACHSDHALIAGRDADLLREREDHRREYLSARKEAFDAIDRKIAAAVKPTHRPPGVLFHLWAAAVKFFRRAG